MLNKQIQLDLFEQGPKIKKVKEEPTGSQISPTRSKFPTQFCALVACSIIIIIVTFALGIERGKVIGNVIAEKKISSNYLLASVENKEKQISDISDEISIKDSETQKASIKASIVNKQPEKKEKNVRLENARYIIQIVTYKKDSSYIKKEISKLQQKGYKTFIVSRGDYRIICTGEFNEKKTALIELEKLKNTYKDCFIKKI